MSPDPCSFAGCSGKRHARRLCNGHYRQQLLGQDLRPLQQYLSAAVFTIADVFAMYVIEQDGCWGWSGGISAEGYSEFSLGGQQVYAHRASYEIHVGPIPEDMLIDHKCHNRSCVNPGHLQTATNKQNHENRPGPQSNSTTGVRGVSWSKRDQRFEAYVKHWGVRHRVGYFRNLDDAEAAVIAKRNELYTNNLVDRSAS